MKLNHAGLWAPIVAALLALALLPTAVLAENPTNNGHHYHYGWVHHKTPPNATTPPPTTVGTPKVKHTTVPAAVAPSGVTGAALPATEHLVPSTSTTTPVAALVPTPVSNPWLLVIVLASIVAANVAMGVLGLARGGNFVVRRVLDPVPVRT